MTRSSDEGPALLPCPFCGGTNTQIQLNPYWTGMKYNVISATVIHWCKEEKFTSILKIKGKTEEEAITKWNSRVGAYA